MRTITYLFRHNRLNTRNKKVGVIEEIYDIMKIQMNNNNKSLKDTNWELKQKKMVDFPEETKPTTKFRRIRRIQ